METQNEMNVIVVPVWERIKHLRVEREQEEAVALVALVSFVAFVRVDPACVVEDRHGQEVLLLLVPVWLLLQPCVDPCALVDPLLVQPVEP